MNQPDYNPPREDVYAATPVQPGDSPSDASGYAPGQAPLPPQDPVIRNISGKPIERMGRAKEILRDQYWSMLGFCFLGMLVASLLPMGILMGPVMCGLFICYAECRAGRRAAFDHLTKGVDYFGDSVVAILIMVAFSMLVTLPVFGLAAILFVVGMGVHEVGDGVLTAVMISGAIVMYLLGFLVSFLVYVPFVFVIPLIVDRRMKGMDAVKLSAKAAWQNFRPVSWFVMGNFLSSILAALLCYIPAILLMPLHFASTFELYYEVFDWSEKKAEPTDKGAY